MNFQFIFCCISYIVLWQLVAAPRWHVLNCWPL